MRQTHDMKLFLFLWLFSKLLNANVFDHVGKAKEMQAGCLPIANSI
jgi:hypothetical protein